MWPQAGLEGTHCADQAGTEIHLLLPPGAGSAKIKGAQHQPCVWFLGLN